jgi:hypothetical protein
VLEGYAETKWYELKKSSFRSSSNPYNIYHYGKESYLKTEFNLMGYQEMLPGSNHTFSFTCTLPSELPSTVKETHGEIQYLITLVFDRPFQLDLRYSFGFMVMRSLDLNEVPELQLPVQQEVVKNYRSICRSKPIVLTAVLPMSGFLAGDNTMISINLNNPTRIKIPHIEVNLVKMIEYRSLRPTKKTKLENICVHQEIVEETVKNGLTSHEMEFPIPQCVASSEIDPDRIIKISYKIQVKAKVMAGTLNCFYKIVPTLIYAGVQSINNVYAIVNKVENVLVNTYIFDLIDNGVYVVYALYSSMNYSFPFKIK